MKCGPWEIPDKIELLIEFAKRIDAAQAIKSKQITVRENKTALIYGSAADPYQVTLDTCSCADFTHRKYDVPCKHIIRLAAEAGVLVDIPVFSEEKSSRYDFDSDLSRLTRLWEDGIITGQTFAKCAGALLDEKKGKGAPKAKPRKPAPRPKPTTDGVFIVITGTPSNGGDRVEIAEIAMQKGFRVMWSVSPKTNILVVLDNPDQRKISKAKELGLPVLFEAEFQDMLKC